MNMMRNKKEINVQVHVTHCCDIHGCKYPYISDALCPVANGNEKPKYGCEICDSDFEDIVENYNNPAGDDW